MSNTTEITNRIDGKLSHLNFWLRNHRPFSHMKWTSKEVFTDGVSFENEMILNQVMVVVQASFHNKRRELKKEMNNLRDRMNRANYCNVNETLRHDVHAIFNMLSWIF